MQEAIKTLNRKIESMEEVRDAWANDKEEDLSDEVVDFDNKIAQLQAAIEVLENAQLIDKEPLNTLLVNTLRCNTQTQRLLIKNIVERNGELMAKKDPRVDGLPEILANNSLPMPPTSGKLLIWHKEYGVLLGKYHGFDVWWAELPNSELELTKTDDILFYCDPDDIV